MATRRRLRRLVLLGSVAAALGALRRRKLAENERRFEGEIARGNGQRP